MTCKAIFRVKRLSLKIENSLKWPGDKERAVFDQFCKLVGSPQKRRFVWSNFEAKSNKIGQVSTMKVCSAKKAETIFGSGRKKNLENIPF